MDMKWNCQNCKYSSNSMDEVMDHTKKKSHIMRMKQTPYQYSPNTV